MIFDQKHEERREQAMQIANMSVEPVLIRGSTWGRGALGIFREHWGGPWGQSSWESRKGEDKDVLGGGRKPERPWYEDFEFYSESFRELRTLRSVMA